MAREVPALIGSGTVESTRVILTPAQRGTNTASRNGYRTGTQVMVGNPEDLNSVDAFAASGVVVSTTPVEVIGPHINPLPRSREVVIQNVGANPALIGHFAGFQDGEAFELSAGGTAGANRRIILPLLHNVSVWARSTSGTTLKFIVY